MTRLERIGEGGLGSYVRSLDDRDLMRWIARLIMSPRYDLSGYDEMLDLVLAEHRRRWNMAREKCNGGVTEDASGV